MGPQVVIAAYRPRPGREQALWATLREHVPTLRRLGFATERPVLLLRAPDGTLLEILEGRTADAARQAHKTPQVAAIWEALAKDAETPPLASLPWAGRPFPHLAAVDGVVR